MSSTNIRDFYNMTISRIDIFKSGYYSMSKCFAKYAEVTSDPEYVITAFVGIFRNII